MCIQNDPFYKIGNIWLIFAGVFLGIVLILWGINLFIFNHLVLQINIAVQGCLCLVWLILGFAFKRNAARKFANRERLMAEGACFPAETLRLVPHYYMNYGNRLSVHAECAYRNQEGKTCLVKSILFMAGHHHLISGGENRYTANIYVSRNDPRDYFVDVAEKAEADGKIDYDYR
jgi:hypothetical protein